MKKSDIPFPKLPSFETLSHVLEHYHKAGHTYIQIFRDKNKDNKLRVLISELRKLYLTGFHKFHHDLLLLQKAQVVEVVETKEHFDITFVKF